MNLTQSGLLALVVASFTVSAQDNDSDDLQPAVSSATLEQMDAGPASEMAPDDLAEMEPAVPTAVLAADVRRRSGNSGGVMDELDLGRTEITGNQELPKVLYIVPWQKSDPGDLTGKPVNTLLDEILAPVDRTEFLRQVDYYDDLYGETE